MLSRGKDFRTGKIIWSVHCPKCGNNWGLFRPDGEMWNHIDRRSCCVDIPKEIWDKRDMLNTMSRYL